jgi:nitroreductase/NAD-dependent dihydropyrimidine dehydrogenase PreA subunit
MAWEDVRDILRPEGVHMGVMRVDPEKCTGCGLCIKNCPFKAWEEGEDGIPGMKDEYECFSCYNCMAACPEGAISIVEPYHVDEGYWVTDSHPLPARMPLEPKDAEGNPDEWNAIERAVLQRRSVRNFKDMPVPEHLIRRVLEAGRFAPSAGNCQPWKFMVVTNKHLIREMNEGIQGVMDMLYNMYRNDEMVKGLEPLARSQIPGPGTFDPRQILGGTGSIVRRNLPPLLNAPAVILMLGDDRAITGPQINIGICGQNMNLVANSLGIKACWVGFVVAMESIPALKDKLGIRPPWHIITSIALGYPAFRQEGIVPREFRPVTWFREGREGAEIEA